tara:strand:+ start:45002 stop:45325 length:324 start_codon:yes stop_codon:yes gene_type:complete
MTFIDAMNQLGGWMSDRWKSGLAFIFSLIIIIDFGVLAYQHDARVNSVEYIEAILKEVPEDERGEVLKVILAPRQPITTFGGGLFYIGMGAIFTGAAVGLGGNRQKK